MRSKAISISSDSASDEDVPLTIIKVIGSKDPNSYQSLRQYRPEACEFCERISKDRYSSLIHNVKHIIIPLLKQNISQCTICLHSFTSEAELFSHTVKKHPDVPLSNFLVKESNVSQPVKDTTITNIKQIGSHNNVYNDTRVPDSGVPIKSRLVFEDDDPIVIDCSQVLNDLTTDCKVNIELFNMKPNDEFSNRSIHYDELKKPGVFRCKKCSKRFPVRFDAIVHEATHIKIENTQISFCVICKQYLVGGRKVLRHHYLTFHNDPMEGRNEKAEMDYLPKFFDENIEGKWVFGSKILTLCDLCFSFCRNKSTMNYEFVKSLCEVGKRYECEKCGLKYFEIKLVKRSVKKRNGYGPHSLKKKKKTNEERLKMIANRFKMLKH
ncbi:unnamed protein product [Spodoptera littoralis]|uniref:C2H2-type domain-containing protein n=1 Tax=Spodoptera littoralis TaxID=7109 RepID=A0A9P0I859_SPOLI|nr:unnamed protein product [Spodoptera littoralis]CAH1641992.1 unnamed protein product [Spodoptera littoralis]